MKIDPLKQYQLTSKRHLQQLYAISFIKANSQCFIQESLMSISDEETTVEQIYSVEQETPSTFKLPADISYSYIEDDFELFSSSESCCCYEPNKQYSQQQQHINLINQKLLFAYE
ncbi:Hypothetical_protein [Hexamita inflata]|uniref:Hypothetical_protein n=1 Tax=Hexamita inflata TaxID=28002 RepID=A0AA86N9T2_9EUKA|nr:Hypothetical protein HINF_LOCUS3369 [Hexamita inflata]